MTLQAVSEGPADLEDYSELVELLARLMHNEASHSDPLLEVRRLLVRPAWHARAACRGMGTRAFFPVRGETGAEAKAICAACSVRRECFTAASSGEERGIWAGTVDKERAEMRRECQKVA